MPANPEAIAWYVQRSEGIPLDLRGQVRSFRSRGVQLAGFSGAVLALAGANAESMLTTLSGTVRYLAGLSLLVGCCSLVLAFVTSLLPRSVPNLSGLEVANYASDRFVEEQDLWRVQVRAIRGQLLLIERTTHQSDEAARAIGRAERLLSAGMAAVGVALVILVAGVTF